MVTLISKMRSFPRLPACALIGTMLIAVLSACHHHANSRPISALSETEKTTLDRYEDIRAALATDDLRTAKRAGDALAESLKADAGAMPAAPAMLADSRAIASATTPDKAREAFKSMSAALIQTMDGVQGLYVFDSPYPAGSSWIQNQPKIDNPYVGKALHDLGSIRK